MEVGPIILEAVSPEQIERLADVKFPVVEIKFSLRVIVEVVLHPPGVITITDTSSRFWIEPAAAV